MSTDKINLPVREVSHCCPVCNAHKYNSISSSVDFVGPNKNEPFYLTTVAMELKHYATMTKLENAAIIESLKNLDFVLGDISHSEFFPTTDLQPDMIDCQKPAILTVPVPTKIFDNMVETTCNHSFSQIMTQEVVHPESKKVYRRLVHLVGIDIDSETSAIYQIPNFAQNTLHFLKFPSSMKTAYDCPYLYHYVDKEDIKQKK